MGNTDVNEKKLFVLVHGACHGAWCWYKVTARLKAGDHSVMALDMAASGIDKRAIEEVNSMEDYSRPLFDFLESLPPNEKVILVGHSLGGMSVALAMDTFPEKIAASVFVTALLPDTVHAPSYVVEQLHEKIPPANWMDTKLEQYKSTNGTLKTSMLIGPMCFASMLYQLCPVEDLELAKSLARPSSLFLEDLAKAKKLSESGFGSVPRVYVVCNKDAGLPEDFQRWMISNGHVSDVFEIPSADHMPMLSTPQELCDIMVEIAIKYA